MLGFDGIKVHRMVGDLYYSYTPCDVMSYVILVNKRFTEWCISK